MKRTAVTFGCFKMTGALLLACASLALNANAQVVSAPRTRVSVQLGGVYTQQPYYRPSRFRGVTLSVYSRGRYFAPHFYVWAGTPWRTAVRYRWNWSGSSWYAANTNYFIAEPSYTSAPVWLSDYVIATGLQQCSNCVGGTYAPITSQVKQAVSNEIQREISQQSTGASSSIFDGQYHVLVATTSLPASTATQQCMINGGDVIEFDGRSANESVATVRVVSSRGQDCPAGSVASVWTSQLQDMANQMAQTVDQGLDSLRAQQDQGGMPSDQNVNAYQPDPTSTVQNPGNSVILGQTIAEVESVLGTPAQKVDLGSKKLYIYGKLKVTFIDGRVSDVN